MVSRAGGYAPARGDLVWIDFSPQAGHEQAGRRPGLVISPEAYNRKTGLALVCPVTNQVKGYPFEVVLPKRLRVAGAVLCDHVKNQDWRARRAEFADKVPDEIIADVLAKLATLTAL